MNRSYPSLVGFRNSGGTSCFIDSVLVAMFGPFIVYGDQNANNLSRVYFNTGIGGFYSVLVLQDISSRPAGSGTECNKDVFVDSRIKAAIQQELRKTFYTLQGGVTNQECSILRDLLGRVCGLDSRIDENDLLNPDFSQGQHSASELYQRLMKVFGYAPMKYSQSRVYGLLQLDEKGEFEKQEVCKSKTEAPIVATSFPVNVNELYRANLGQQSDEEGGIMDNELEKYSNSLEFAWRPKNVTVNDTISELDCFEGGKVKSVSFNYMAEYSTFEDCDCLVFEINRSFPADLMRQTVDNNTVIASFDQYVGVPNEISGFYKGKPQKYRILSAVIHYGISSKRAHYKTLLRVPFPKSDGESKEGKDAWFEYDDLTNNYQSFTDARASYILSTRATILFYFPWNSPGPVKP